eukprot:655547-Prymnesium_polylepis.1
MIQLRIGDKGKHISTLADAQIGRHASVLQTSLVCSRLVGGHDVGHGRARMLHAWYCSMDAIDNPCKQPTRIHTIVVKDGKNRRPASVYARCAVRLHVLERAKKLCPRSLVGAVEDPHTSIAPNICCRAVPNGSHVDQ